jgi:hypothetical protein
VHATARLPLDGFPIKKDMYIYIYIYREREREREREKEADFMKIYQETPKFDKTGVNIGHLT